MSRRAGTTSRRVLLVVWTSRRWVRSDQRAAGAQSRTRTPGRSRGPRYRPAAETWGLVRMTAPPDESEAGGRARKENGGEAENLLRSAHSADLRPTVVAATGPGTSARGSERSTALGHPASPASASRMGRSRADCHASPVETDRLGSSRIHARQSVRRTTGRFSWSHHDRRSPRQIEAQASGPRTPGMSGQWGASLGRGSGRSCESDQ